MHMCPGTFGGESRKSVLGLGRFMEFRVYRGHIRQEADIPPADEAASKEHGHR